MSPDVILGVMSAGGFVHMGFLICRGFCPQGVLSWIPNTTSVLQPLDQGIIQVFKARYRKHLLKSVIAKIDSAETVSQLCKDVTVLDAIHWIYHVWTETQSDTIAKCLTSVDLPQSTAPSMMTMRMTCHCFNLREIGELMLMLKTWQRNTKRKVPK